MAIKLNTLPPDILALIRIYKNAQLKIISTIATAQAKGNITAYQRSILRQVEFQLKQLENQFTQWVNDNIPKYYQKGIQQTNKALSSMGINIADNAFSLLHTKAVEVLVRNTLEDLRQAGQFVGRQINDIVRQVGIDVISQKIATGSTVRQAKQELISRLISTGINGIRDKRGRYISLDAYAQTVARSTTREATNTATLNQLKYNGYDLVKMSQHNSPCPICAPLEGRVYSISGNDTRYPPLNKAYNGPYANIHPNCRHVLTPYIEELADNPEEDRQYSNRPFDIDPRSAVEKKRYDNAQRYNRDLRRDRNQWERYRLAMPEDTPKTLSGFRRMKQANSDRWQELQSDYRRLRRAE